MSVAALNSNGYKFYGVNRNDRTGGGIGITCKSGVKAELINSGENDTFEYGEWKIKAGQNYVTFVVVYRPPSASEAAFITEFSDYLSGLCISMDKFVISGDFNLKVNEDNNIYTRRFNDILESFGLTQYITFSTHEKGNTLDLLIIRDNTGITCRAFPGELFSDHRFIHAKLSLPTLQFEQKYISFRKIKSIKTDILRRDLQQIVSESENITNLNDLLAHYNSSLEGILNKHAPVIRKFITDRPKLPWYNSQLLVMKQEKRKAERKWRKTRLLCHLQKLKESRSKYAQALNKSKIEHINKLVIDCDHNVKKLFDLVSNLTGSKTENPMPNSESDKVLANTFADFFLEKIDKIRKDLMQHPSYIPTKSNCQEFNEFIPLDELEVKKIIMNSKSTSCELDPIPTFLLKENIDILVPLISRIVNLSLVTGQFPQDWKTAIVRPLLKKIGLELIVNNYRPVSNLSFLSKVTEKAALLQFDSHLDNNELKIDYQSAYKKGFSTETALLSLLDNILMSMDTQHVMLMCVIDLSAAFDTVDHDILLSVMSDVCQVSGTALDWFDSYLRPRHM